MFDLIFPYIVVILLIRNEDIMKISKIKTMAIIGIIATTILSGCGNSTMEVVPYTETKFFFDTLITVTIYEDRQDVLDKAMALCQEYQNRFGINTDGSEIKAINESNGEPITVSDDMLTLLNTGIEYAAFTEGAFDITIKPLTDLWNIGTDNQNIPNDNDIASTLNLVDYNAINIEDKTVQLSQTDMMIDLGAIAKGYIADQLKELLIQEGITSGIINLGGNIHTIGRKPDNSLFEIGIQKPFGTNTESISSVLVDDKCVVTAGVYQRYFEENDVIYHHIFDATTGKPVDNDIWSVTIIADDALTADILSTVCLIIGYDEASEYIRTLDNVEAIFVTNESEVIETK